MREFAMWGDEFGVVAILVRNESQFELPWYPYLTLGPGAEVKFVLEALRAAEEAKNA